MYRQVAAGDAVHPTRPLTPKQRHAAAFHEAGHAVVGVVLHLGVLEAVIGDEYYPRRGYTRQRGYVLRGLVYPEGRARRELASLYAGQLAERMATGRISRVGASGDQQSIPVVLFGYPLSRWPRLKSDARAVGRSHLEANWDAVVQIADRLEAMGRVTGREVRATIRQTRSR